MRAAVVVITLAACSSGTSPAPAPVAAEAGPAVALRVDGAKVADVRVSDLRGRVALASLVPDEHRAGWLDVHAHAGKRTLRLDPFDDYDGLDVVVEANGGELALSVYRPVPPDAPAHVAAELAKPRLSMSGIEAIEIARTPRPEDQAGAAPAFAPFTVAVGGVSKTIYPIDLEPLAKASSSDRGEGGKKREGWELADVLALVAPGEVSEITVTGEDTQTIALGKDLVMLRPNRRGLLGLHVFRDGERVHHVRAVASITAKEQ